MSKLKNALRYRLVDSAKDAAIFCGIMLLAFFGMEILLFFFKDKVTFGLFTPFDLSGMIVFFIFGICTFRDDIRLMLQNGTGRNTLFVSELITSVTVAAATALFGTLLLFGFNGIFGAQDGVVITSLSALLENGENISPDYAMSFSDALKMFFMCFSMFVAAFYAGNFLSLLFYRPPSPWNIILGVGTILIAVNGSSWLFAIKLVADTFSGFITGTVSLSVIALILAAVLSVASLLLLRKAPVNKRSA